MSKKGRTAVTLATAAVVPLALLLAWEGIVRFNLVPPSQAAAPSAVVGKLLTLILNGSLLQHVYVSLMRIGCGLLIGTSLGIVSGITLATSRLADRLLSPTLQLLAGIPVVIWIPFWVMFFGTAEAFKISMAAISTFFLVHLYTFMGVRSVGRGYLELAAIYEKTIWAKIHEVLLPSAAPAIFSSIRTSLAFCWVVIFFVEYASAKQGTEGLGWFIADSRQVGRIEEEFAGLLFLGLVAFVTDKSLGTMQRHLLKWSDTLESSLLPEV